ncbi:uncharacterized protein LOC114545461 [Perca flavescens]|uniref:uncharacterized protein LOC114545461 n=1 Tax=Perca flavescens TaxID=8167 RepID=UPI00106E6980|nr:uncharacterized protein LOC114545461 [Perca flavescens]
MDSLKSCQAMAQRKIPEILIKCYPSQHSHVVVSLHGAETLLSFLVLFSAKLEADPLSQARYKFYGYIRLIASIYGHRLGVLANMRMAEVMVAKERADDGVVICINKRKTNKHFGPAHIYLDQEEFSRMERWLAIREEHSPPNDFVFFTAGKGPVKNMVRYMQTVWVEMGLEGRPNFTDLRTAVSATYQKRPLKRGEEGDGDRHVP